ncbi:BTB/POZ and MATH domain-containing protein 2-like [Triticum urartu]|nr:BTB/POZ and MATH domain-containing protein 2-like [Triticum urartu]
MSSFAGITLLAEGDLSPSTADDVDAGTDYGYHLLVVQDYLLTKELTPSGRGICSRAFVVGGHTWYIEYYPNGESSKCADYISLHVSVLDNDEDYQKTVKAKVCVSLIDQVEKHKPMYIRGTGTRTFGGYAFMRLDKFMKKDVLEESVNLKGNCLTIRCDIMVLNTDDDDANGDEVLPPDVRHQFNSLLQNKVGADVTFEVSGETFVAHRCVLAARSTVFMAQLFGPMKEGTTRSAIIQIKDMEAKVFKALLSFIYTDSFPEMEEEDKAQVVEKGQEEDEMRLQWLQDLLVAADRYDVQGLKFICEKQFSERLGVSSVMSTLALAEQHRCWWLKGACFKYLQVQPPSRLLTVMESSGWDNVFTTYPSALKDLIAKLIALNQQK